MSLSDLIRSMAAAGAPPEAIALAVEAIEARDRKEEDRKSKRAEQKRQERARAATVARLSRDNDATVARQDPSPSPPRDIINPPIPAPSSVSLRSTEETRDKRATAAQEAAGEFERFWSIWPHRVGKPAAAKAFFRVRDEVEAILAGVPRYVAETERLGRPWLNPATFLNQRRWEDAPAASPRAGPRAPPVERRNTAFAAYETIMAERSNAKNQRDDPDDSGGTTLDFAAIHYERSGFI